MKKILAIGYIPKQFGGKQTTGLATGIFDLHDSVNALNSEYQVIIAATDIHEEKIKINNSTVIGWNRNILIKYLVKHPIRFLYFVYRVFYLFIRFQKLVSFPTTLAKAVFLDYAIEKTKPDLVHFHGSSGALLFTCIWHKKHNILLRLHGLNGYNPSIPNNTIHKKIEKFITSLNFLKVTFVARGIQKEWENKYGLFPCEMISIHNGYNSKLFYPPNGSINKKYDLITISGLSENKGQIRVIDALIKLKKEGVNLTYLIIGSGNVELVKKINKLVKNNNLKVTLKDYLPQQELNEYLHQSKYFILPSITEGFGKVFIESIGSGTPVIIPNHLPLAIEAGILNAVNSIKIDSYDTESIYSGMKHVFKHPLKIQSVDVAETVKKLQWNHIAIEYAKFYQSIF